MTQPSSSAVADLLQREALLLDLRRWDDWLELYHHDCLLWVPTWRDHDTVISDPRSEVSFLYLRGKAGLAERTRRLLQDKSITTHPLPRTSHHVSAPVWLDDAQLPDGGAWHSQWVNHLHDPRTHHSSQLFGRYRHRFVHDGTAWRIHEKVVTLLNDRIATVLDVYSV